jgi:transcriptional regulator with XRE-family HTH domain
MAKTATAPQVGSLLREWRHRRRRSQLDLALDAGVSARHISFIETGRSKPSRPMVSGLAETLEVPLRERNQLLLAAGYSPEYRELAYEDPELTPVRDAIQQVLDAHDPFPALVVDRHWELVAANRGLGLLTATVDPDLLEPPANALRISLHPRGLAPRMLNHAEWRAHTLDRLSRQLRLTADPAIEALIEELAAYPHPEWEGPERPLRQEVFVPLRLRAEDGGELSFFGTVATFGTAVDITVAELSIESFFPADSATAAAMQAWAAASS